MNFDLNKLDSLIKKALIYEDLGKEHFPIRNLELYDKRCDISAHLHCEIVELWLAVIQNQSVEQIVDELADILCIWNLAVVLYQKSKDKNVELKRMSDEALQIIKTDKYLNLVPDARKNWKLRKNDFSDDLVSSIDQSISKNKIKCIFNMGSGNEIDIFSLYHKVVNDFWNSIRKNKELDEIYSNLVIIFAVWILSVRVLSLHMKYDISYENIIEIASDIFTAVANKKFNINI